MVPLAQAILLVIPGLVLLYKGMWLMWFSDRGGFGCFLALAGGTLWSVGLGLFLLWLVH